MEITVSVYFVGIVRLIHFLGRREGRYSVAKFNETYCLKNSSSIVYWRGSISWLSYPSKKNLQFSKYLCHNLLSTDQTISSWLSCSRDWSPTTPLSPLCWTWSNHRWSRGSLFCNSTRRNSIAKAQPFLSEQSPHSSWWDLQRCIYHPWVWPDAFWEIVQRRSIFQ